MQEIKMMLISYMPMVFMACVILVIGLVLAYMAKKMTLKATQKISNRAMANFLSRLVHIIVIVLTIIIVLSRLGVPTTSLVAVLGAASLAIGLSLKNFLANLAAGFLIIFLRPFKIGDFIEVGSKAGTVSDINLFMTHLNTTANEALFFPNNKIINDFIINKSFHDHKRLDLFIGIAYDADLKQAKQLIDECLKSHLNVQAQPAPLVVVNELADSAVILLVRFWCRVDQALSTKFALLEDIKSTLDENNINIPYPQLDVHLQANMQPDSIQQ